MAVGPIQNQQAGLQAEYTVNKTQHNQNQQSTQASQPNTTPAGDTVSLSNSGDFTAEIVAAPEVTQTAPIQGPPESEPTEDNSTDILNADQADKSRQDRIVENATQQQLVTNSREASNTRQSDNRAIDLLA